MEAAKPKYMKKVTHYYELEAPSDGYLPPKSSSTTTTRQPQSSSSYHQSLPTSLTPPQQNYGHPATNIYTTSSSEHEVPTQTSTQATIIQTTTGTPLIINLNSNPPMVVIPKEMMNMTQIGTVGKI